MHAPGSNPLIATCPAAVPGVLAVACGPERTASSRVGNASTHVTVSATRSAGRSRDEDLCRRRGRAGTLAGFAIGRAIVVAAAYLIRPFSEAATFLLAFESTLITARITSNVLFCQSAM